jgi:hypothetical protein
MAAATAAEGLAVAGTWGVEAGGMEAADIREECIMEAVGTSVGASVTIGVEGSVSIVAADLAIIEVRGVSIAAMGTASDLASEDMGLD